MKFLPFLALLLCTLFSNAVAQWEPTPGPGRVAVNLVARDGTLLYAGTQTEGVYRSSDEGATWAAANAGLPGNSVTSFAAYPGRIFVGLQNAGVYRSSDQGATWQAAGLGGRWITCLLAVGTTLYAGDFAQGVSRTTDGGNTWTPANQGIETESIHALVANGGNLFAAGSNNLYISTDGGGSWDFTNGGQFFQISSLASSGSNIYAGGIQGIIRSTNGGASWSNRIDILFLGELDRVTSFAVDGGALYASTASSPGSGGSGVIRSTDAGLNWTPLNAGIEIVATNTVLASGARLLAAAPDQGVLLSTNTGATWSKSIAGLPPGGNIRDLVVSGSEVFAGTQGDGVYKSTNQGASWVKVSDEPTGMLRNETVQNLAVFSNVLLAGTSFHGVFRSTNGGASWSAANTGLPQEVFVVEDLAVAGGNFLVGTSLGIFWSTDLGVSWLESSLQGHNGMALAAAGGFAYANWVTGIFTEDGIYRSTNGGFTWSLVFQSFDTSFVEAMAAKDTFVYAGSFLTGMLRSTNNGINWEDASPDPGTGVYAVLPVDNDVYAGGEPGIAQLYKSTNHGVSWSGFDEGFAPRILVEALEASSVFFFAGTEERGVWRRLRTGAADVPDLSDLGPAGLMTVLPAAPNPFRPRTTFRFSLSRPAYVTLRVLDARGARVADLLGTTLGAGLHAVPWDATGRPSGTYFWRLQAGDQVRTSKVTLAK